MNTGVHFFMLKSGYRDGETRENTVFRLVRAPAMTEQSEPYHGEIVHTQEVRGSSPFAPMFVPSPCKPLRPLFHFPFDSVSVYCYTIIDIVFIIFSNKRSSL